MDTKKICNIGYFDKLIIDGMMMPMYNNKGIEIKQDESLLESLENNANSFNQGVGKLRIDILGESIRDKNIETMLNIHFYRENELKIERRILGDTDRYLIGYIDILILKSDSSFPEVINKGKTLNDIIKFSKNTTELNLLSKALDIQTKYNSNVAIIDKVYVHKGFRRNHISTWIHKNIREIIKLYAMIDVSAILLTPGDFNNEAEILFNISKDKYEKMLIKHYKSVGYKLLDNRIMIKYIK